MDSSRPDSWNERERQLAERIRQLEEELRSVRGETRFRQPSRGAVIGLAVFLAVALAVAFLAGYLPKRRIAAQVLAEKEKETNGAVPVRVSTAVRVPGVSKIRLPGTLQAMTEAPVLARADGYIKQRYADIGDRVKAGQLLAEIEAPELDQQAKQAAAALGQAKSSFERAKASLQQAMANQELARVTALRWANLLQRGVVSRQENDQQQANFKAQSATVEALAKAVEVERSNVAAAEANLARIEQIRSYLKVRAPFSGVVTLRNIDTGALVTAGNTLLFRLAEIHLLRAYLNVPQTWTASVRPGMTAELTLAERPSAKYAGRVTRTSDSLDPATRTMLVEVQVPNRDGSLLPGMFVQVTVDAPRPEPPLLVDSEAIQVRANGIYVAAVGPDQRVREKQVQVGTDYGKQIEVLSGIEEGALLIVNPSDAIHEGVLVKPIRLEEGKKGGRP